MDTDHARDHGGDHDLYTTVKSRNRIGQDEGHTGQATDADTYGIAFQ